MAVVKTGSTYISACGRASNAVSNHKTTFSGSGNSVVPLPTLPHHNGSRNSRWRSSKPEVPIFQLMNYVHHVNSAGDISQRISMNGKKRDCRHLQRSHYSPTCVWSIALYSGRPTRVGLRILAALCEPFYGPRVPLLKFGHGAISDGDTSSCGCWDSSRYPCPRSFTGDFTLRNLKLIVQCKFLFWNRPYLRSFTRDFTFRNLKLIVQCN